MSTDGAAAPDFRRMVASAGGILAPGPSGLVLPTGSASPAGSPGPGSFAGWTEHIARYLISDEYAPRWCAERGERYTPEGWLSALLAMCPRESLLLAITAGTRVAGAGREPLKQWTEYALANVDASLAGHLEAAMTVVDGGPDRVFLARQPLLLALKLVLGSEADGKGTADPFVVASLLSHHAAREPVTARHPDPSGRLLAGLPVALAMELVQNSLFNTADDYGDLMARTRMLWTRYEGRLKRYKPRLPLSDLLLEATGMELDDLLTMAFAVFAHADTAEVGQARVLDLGSLGLPPPAVEAFLARFSVTESELTQLLASHQGEWALLPLEDTPLLRLGPAHVAVLDLRLMERRFTSALYWLVHDHERELGQKQRIAWTQVYSELVEIHAEDILERLAPPLLGGGSAFFTEEQLGKLGGSAADCGIDWGNLVVIADVVQHQMTVKTRMLGDVDAFEADMKATVLKKAKQLDGTVTVLLDSPEHPAHPLGPRPERLLPVVVQGADFPVNPVTVGYARQKAAEQHLLTQPECQPLIIVTISELETLEGLVQVGLATGDGILRAYAATGGQDSLRNFIIDTHGGSALQRPESVQRALEDVLQVFTDRFGHLDAAV